MTTNLTELLKQMTLEEKIGQCVQLTSDFYGEEGEITGPMTNLGITANQVANAGSVIGIHGAKKAKKIQEEYLKKSRLKIPLVFMVDIIHGSETIFPTPLAISGSFKTDNAKICAQVSAKEGAAQGNHVTFAPMCDLARDARWGRNMETSGEDPFLGSLFSKAYVEGFQSDDLKNEGTLASCAKHFAGYGLVLAGREYNNVDISERFLREFHFPSYKAAIDAGTTVMMTAFNTINSIPCTGNEWLFRDILRDEMKFDGMVISDWGAVKEQINNQTAANEYECATKAMNAGCDMEMMTPCYYHELENAINKGDVTMETLDESVMNILKLKEKLGLFVNPYRFASEDKEQEIVLSDEHKQLALQVAKESIVMVKNNNNILPLTNTNVGLTGPLANSNDLLGAWSWQGDRNLVKPLSELLGAANFVESGHHRYDSFKDQEIVIYVGGEFSLESGEANSKTDISLPSYQVEEIKNLKLNNKKVILVLFNGRPMDLSQVEPLVDAILVCWQLGTMASEAVNAVLTGVHNPNAKLTMSFPRSVGQCPIFYNDFRTGRPVELATDGYVSKYVDCDNSPLYAFGHGLNYSDSKITNVEINNRTVNVTLANNGTPCCEVVQLYIKDLAADVVRPKKELKGFEVVEFNNECNVEFTITDEMLSYYNTKNEYKWDEGEFEIMVGLSSDTTINNTIQFYKH